MLQYVRLRRRKRGGVLLTALAISVVISCILAGVSTFTLANYSRVITESGYAGSLNIAEAGINYELRKLSDTPGSADQAGSNTPPGNTYNFGGGNFRVYCTNLDGSTPWSSTPDATTGLSTGYILSTGTISGTSRTIKIRFKGVFTLNTLGVFPINSLSMNGSTSITGNVGTDGTLTLNTGATISGAVSFNGPSSNWSSGSATSGSPITFNANPVIWLTVDQIAYQMFPNSGSTAPGGLAYLATHNDNALVSQISSNQLNVNSSTVVTFVGKAGGANYYLTSMTFGGSSTAKFNNTNGPINIWIGPSGGNSSANLAGGTASISTSTDVTKACRIYVATVSGISLSGSAHVDAGIYAYNKSGGNPIGQVNTAGGSIVTGQILTNNMSLSGSTVTGVQNVFSSGVVAYYGFDNYWTEIGGM